MFLQLIPDIAIYSFSKSIPRKVVASSRTNLTSRELLPTIFCRGNYLEEEFWFDCSDWNNIGGVEQGSNWTDVETNRS